MLNLSHFGHQLGVFHNFVWDNFGIYQILQSSINFIADSLSVWNLFSTPDLLCEWHNMVDYSNFEYITITSKSIKFCSNKFCLSIWSQMWNAKNSNLMNIFKIRSTYLSRLFSSQSVIDLSYKYIKDCIMRIVQLNYSFPSSAFEAFELRFFFIVGPGRALRTCDHKALSRSPSNVQLKLISHVRSTQAIVFCTNHTFWIFVDCICERSRPNEHRILFHRNIDFLLCLSLYK